jgi:hypothetical protein
MQINITIVLAPLIPHRASATEFLSPPVLLVFMLLFVGAPPVWLLATDKNSIVLLHRKPEPQQCNTQNFHVFEIVKFDLIMP